MNWNDETQARFDQLRMMGLQGALNETENAELATLTASLETAEADYLVPVMAQMAEEQAVLVERLQKVQADNEELAKLLTQQEQLAAEARRWLTQFQQRHRQIQDNYMRLTGEALTAV